MKYLLPQIEIDEISFSEKDNAFIVKYTIYREDGKPVITDTAIIEHNGDVTDMHYTTIEALKKALKDKLYETKTKN